MTDDRTNTQIEASMERVFVRQLRLLGIDVTDQDSVNSLRDDLRHLHQSRLAAEARGRDVSKGLITALFSAVVTAGVAWAAGVLHMGKP